MRLLIDPGDILDRPVAAGELGPFARLPAVKVGVAGALGRPDQAAVLQRLQIVCKVDPGLRRLAEQERRLAGDRVDPQDVEPLLVAAHPLDEEALAVLGPVDAGQIDVRVAAEVGLDPAAAVRRHDVEVDDGVPGAGGGVALLDQPRPLGTDRGAGDDRHRAFIDPGDGDEAVVRRPPIAGLPPHLLLRDELGRAPAQRAAAVAGQRPLPGRGEVHDEDVLVAEVGEVAAGLRHLGVDLRLLGLGQAADLAVEAGEVEVAVDRHQDRFAVRRPAIIGDPLGAGDAKPLAAHLLFLGNVGAGADLLRIDQHPRGAGGCVDRPEIEAVLLLLPVAKERDQPSVRGQPGQARRRAGERGALEQPFQRQVPGLGGDGSGGEDEERDQGFAHGGAP